MLEGDNVLYKAASGTMTRLGISAYRTPFAIVRDNRWHQAVACLDPSM